MKNLKYFGCSLKNLTFRGGFHKKNRYRGGGAWTVCRFKEGGGEGWQERGDWCYPNVHYRGFLTITIITKSSILGVTGFLDPSPLHSKTDDQRREVIQRKH